MIVVVVIVHHRSEVGSMRKSGRAADLRELGQDVLGEGAPYGSGPDEGSRPQLLNRLPQVLAKALQQASFAAGPGKTSLVRCHAPILASLKHHTLQAAEYTFFPRWQLGPLIRAGIWALDWRLTVVSCAPWQARHALHPDRYTFDASSGSEVCLSSKSGPGISSPGIGGRRCLAAVLPSSMRFGT